MEMNKAFRRVRKALDDTSENLKFLKVDAISNMFRSDHVALSIIWSVLLLVNASACGFLISDTFRQYQEHHVSTTTRYIMEQESPLPTLVLCNMNPFSNNYALRLLTQYNVTYSGSTMGTIAGNYAVYTRLQTSLAETRGYLLTDDEMRKMSEIDQMLYSCSFQGEPCNASQFEFLYHPYFLTCYRFNPDAEMYSSMTGPTTQLNLEV